MRIHTINAFTDRPFSGNPAAIVLCPEPLTEAYMQDMAAELRLSETAFLVPRPQPGHWGLRWFTPGLEVDLCGHATLGAAHVLMEELGPEEAPLGEDDAYHFMTRSGRLRAWSKGQQLALDLPAAEVLPSELPPGAESALAADARFVGKAGDYYLLELRDADAVVACRPDFRALEKAGALGFIVTAPSDDSTFSFVSRFFAPGMAVDEDPVTGSAHCALGTYWGEKLKLKRMRAFQASQRGGVVELDWQGERMMLYGQARTIWSGRWRPEWPVEATQ
jgi:predicted PhzF superfamily epimerase YddE/YHI9